MKLHKPKKNDDIYYWQCAYTDCAVKPEVLPSYLYDILWAGKEIKPWLQKHYITEESALEDLRRVFRIIDSHLKEWSV